MKQHKILEEGTCKCWVAPMGAGGMEGYNENENYHFQKVKMGDMEYYRVYIDPGYYQTCGKGLFSKHFKYDKTGTN